MERPTDNDNEPQLPATLIEALKAEDQPTALITSRADRALEAQAAAHFAARRSTARDWRPAWYAAAAAAAVALLLVVPREPSINEGIGAQDVFYADVDASGRIDIADVLAVARSGRATQPDIDAFAARVVTLSPPGTAR